MDRADITTSVAACLLETQFPQWSHLPLAPVDHPGWDNTTFRLGDDMSVRLPSHEIYSAQVEKEHRWLPYLAEHLPLPVPQPIAKGVPGCDFPRPWSVYRWLPGKIATVDRVADMTEFAASLGDFLTALYSVPGADGPPPGLHNFHRGESPGVFDGQTKEAVAYLGDEIDAGAAMEVWEASLATVHEGTPVWIHGDLSASNLLVVDGRLGAVIDFGTMAVGDPACDMAIAWTFFFGDNRATFRERVALDDGTWARGRGWMLWKALITLAAALRQTPEKADRAGLEFGWRQSARDVITDVIADHREYGQG